MKKRPTAEQTLAEYVDRSILDGYSRELYPALLGACKQYGFSCFRAGLDQGIAIGMSHAAPEPEPEQYIVSSPALRIAIRALLTPRRSVPVWHRRRCPFAINGPATAQAVRLLRSLHDLQNGPALEKYRQEWEQVMEEIQDFLEKHEK